MIFKVSKHIVKVSLWIASVIVACLMLAAAYGGYMNPQNHSRLFAMMTLALPFVALLTAAFAILLLALHQWRMALVPVGALLLSTPPLLSVFPMTIFGQEVQNERNTFKVMTFNCQGFAMPDDSDAKENVNLRMILEQDADFVVLQETSLGATNYLDMPTMLPLKEQVVRKYPYHSTGYHDLAIMSKYPYTVVQDTTLKQGFGSPDDISSEYHFYAKAFDIKIKGRQLRIINLHLQSIGLSDDDKKLFMELTEAGTTKLHSEAELRKVKASLYDKVGGAFARRAGEAQKVRSIIDESAENVIVCGDFNDTPASFSYRTIMGHDLKDAYNQCAFWPTYTYNDNRFYFKIDQMLYRGAMKAIDCRKLKQGTSDHYPLIATFEWTASQK